MALAHDLRTTLEAHGTVQSVGGNHTFPLSPGDDVLIVLEGALDVFAVQPQQDGVIGRRHTLFRLEPGASVWPLDGLVAVPLPDTVILSVPQATLVSLARDPETRSVALGLLTEWVTFVSVRLGGELDFEREIATDGARVTWVRVTEGTASLNGVVDLTGADLWWLIPPTAWFQKRSSTSLQVAPDASEVVSEPPERWIEPALSIVAHYVAGALALQQARERQRLDARRAVDAQQWRQALHKLGTTFDRTEPGTERIEEGPDPLWRAMSLVADAAGCRLTVLATPEEMDRSERVRRVARASRVPTREVALKDEWWRQDCGPMLAFREDGASPAEAGAGGKAPLTMTPVALLPIRGGYRLVDPDGGAPRRVTRSLAATIYPLAWSFYRTFGARAVGVMDLWRFGVWDVKRELMTMFGVGALSGLVALTTPIATGLIFSDVIPGGQRSQVAVVAMALGVAAIALTMFGLVQGFAMIRIDVRFGGAVQAALWHRLLALPVSFFRDYTAGDLATRAGAVDEIRETLSASTVSALVSTIFSSFNLILLFIYDPQLALLGLLLVVFALAVSVAGAVAQLGRHREVAMWQGRLAGLLMQLLSAVGKIRTAGAEQRAFAQWSGLFSRQVRASVEAARIDNLLGVFSAVYPMTTMMAIFGMVGASVASGGMDTGDFLAFNAAFSAFLGATLQLGGIGVAALGALPAWERAKPIMNAVPESHALKSDPGRLRGGIEFQRVSFRYRTDGPLVLKDVNFTVKPGECIAIVGPSGSGKSTLLRLLLGFEVPTTGAVYFDGHDLERVDLYALRRQLGVVLQDGAVMGGDIYSNIAGANRVELDDAWEAASKAALDEEIRAMPMGMHTVLPEGGGTLSGGQRQRLLIARSLVRNPRILLLDEATSALDNQSQAVVTRSVEQLKATRVIIAHRLTTIRHVDRILVLEDGVLVEEGSFEALMAQDGVFAALARRQMVRGGDESAPAST